MERKMERKIIIQSGKGTTGSYELYAGKQSDHAIKLHLSRERAGGDRWARAWEYTHESEFGPVYVRMFGDHWEARHIDDDVVDGL